MTDQSAAKPLLSNENGESSETISQESRESHPEAGGILLQKQDEDIVHPSGNVQTRFTHFLKRASLQHNNKFDYSHFVYVDAKTAGKVICPVHGEFLQTPDKHLAKNGKGCQQCWNELRGKSNKGKPKFKPTKSKEEFLKRAREKYGEKYEYNLDHFVGLTKEPVEITCSVHGKFSQVPVVHLMKNNATGCPACGSAQQNLSKTGTYDVFLAQVNAVHSQRYTYPESNRDTYQNKKSVVDVVCPLHGSFRKKAQNHVRGQGCFQCRVDELVTSNVLVGGYSERLFQEKPGLKLKQAWLYFLRVGKNYKIGITTNLQRRLSAIRSKSKESVVEVLAKKSGILYDCYQLEQRVLREQIEHRLKRRWSTELFDTNILPEIEHFFR